MKRFPGMNVSTLPGRAALWAVSISLGLCGDAAAHNAAYPIASKVAKVDQRGDFSRHKLVFKTENDPLISPVHSPAVNGAVFLLRWEGENSGRTPLIGLPASHWTGTGRPAGSKGYKYLDKKTTQGPVSKAVFKAGSWRKGGSVSLQAKGGDWPWTLDGGVTTLWFYFGVRNETQPEDIEWYCTKFGDGAGEVKADGQEGMFLARNSPAPDSCPDFCGDGKIDQGEQCDDGNLDETDGCLNTCQLGSCDGGREYDSTWEAVQDQIISEGGCLGCHSGTGPLGAKGELDLDPDVAYGNLINVDAKLYPSHKLITPGAEDRSFFYNKLSAKTYGTPSVPGSPMPGGGLPAILDNQLQGLREWIRSGASETGVTLGTEVYFDGCFADPRPDKVVPLEPPPAGEGVQLYAPGWALPANSEDEVCFATYYDFCEDLPPDVKVSCPTSMGGPSRDCMRYDGTVLLQDRQSHHTLEYIYLGQYDWSHPSMGQWQCLGGEFAGTPCNPTLKGVPATQGGAECGIRSGCATIPETSLACIGWGWPDYGANPLGGGGSAAPNIAGAQESYTDTNFIDGTYSTIPCSGEIVWNHHAFNLTNYDTTLEQYLNFDFADLTDTKQVRQLFDARSIFIMNIPAFEEKEYCSTFTMGQKDVLFQMSSHAHQALLLWRTYEPPHDPCAGEVGTGCNPSSETPMYSSVEYNDPVRLDILPPRSHEGLSVRDRTYKSCAKYDNGYNDIQDVKRYSTSPEPAAIFSPGGPCALSSTRCIGGPNHGVVCGGNHALCDSEEGAGDGDCDACARRGGTTTGDEMMISTGLYYTNSTSRAFLDDSSSLLD